MLDYRISLNKPALYLQSDGDSSPLPPPPPGIGVMKEVEFFKEKFQPVFLPVSSSAEPCNGTYFTFFSLSNKKDQLSI
jgi:hypothetical protein